MALSAFPYAGGKTILSDWIVDQLPDHTVYVEPFGGSAAVLLNKPRSNIEVYNDLNRDAVQFFEVAREIPDELADWARRTPFSEELHQEWVHSFYNGERPEDPVERAGRFLFLRYTQYGGKASGPAGFKRDHPRTRTGASSVWRNVPERIDAVCERLRGVSIQAGNFREVVERYDDEDTLFYCDPPYLGAEGTYGGEFEHGELADALAGIDGFALVSYSDRPEGLYGGWHEITRSHHHHSGAAREDGPEEVTERLLMNFDPDCCPKFVDGEQTTLVQADGGETSSIASTERDHQ